MSMTTWIDATMATIATSDMPYGMIDARFNEARNVTVVTWSFEGRTVLLGEADVQGAKLAKYRVMNNPRVIARLRKLEAEAHATISAHPDSDKDDDLVRAAQELGIDLNV